MIFLHLLHPSLVFLLFFLTTLQLLLQFFVLNDDGKANIIKIAGKRRVKIEGELKDRADNGQSEQAEAEDEVKAVE